MDASARVAGVPHRNRVGRPSKGDRHKFAVSIPRRYADTIIAEAESRDMPYGELIARLAMAALDSQLLRPEQLPPRRSELVVQQELIA